MISSKGKHIDARLKKILIEQIKSNISLDQKSTVTFDVFKSIWNCVDSDVAGLACRIAKKNNLDYSISSFRDKASIVYFYKKD